MKTIVFVALAKHLAIARTLAILGLCVAQIAPLRAESLLLVQTGAVWKYLATSFDLELIASTFTPPVTNTAAGLVWNEVFAHNQSVTNGDGTVTDWVELHNPAGQPVEVAGCSLSDSPATPRRWVFPSNTVLPPHGFLVVRCDAGAPPSTNNSGALNTGFNLPANGGAIYLFDRPANGGALLDALSFGLQAADFSLGRVPDGSGAWTLGLPTAASANVAANLGIPAALKINEWMAAPAAGEDWFELFNPQSQPVALGGLHLTDDLAQRTKHRIPPHSYIGGGERGYAVFYADGNPAAGADHASFRFNNSGEVIGLSTTSGDAIDTVTFGAQQMEVSEGRLPDGTTNIVRFPLSATPGAANWLPAVEPPVITQPPVSQTNYIGSTATFTVGATGTPPLSYQWFRDEMLLSGQTNATLSFASVQFADAGSYYVFVSNAAGSVFSGSPTLTVLPAIGQPGSVDLSFDPGSGTDATVSALALQPDGRILLGGVFTTFNDLPRGHVAQLRTDGRVDLSFNPGTGTDFNLYAVAAQPDGKALIAGGFTTVNGIPRAHLARLNPDGSVDLGFHPQVDRWVIALALQPDGKIVIGGYFTEVNGAVRHCIARLRPDGRLDADFAPTPGADPMQVEAVVVQPDGKVILGGVFHEVNGVARPRIARLNADGSLDASFDPGGGPDSSVFAVALQRDGKVVIGGYFAAVNGVSRRGIARLHADGTLDLSFNPGTGVEHADAPSVHALALQPDGKILAAGWFDWFNGVRRTHLARLNPDGSLDATFAADIECSGWGGGLSAVEVQPDGQVLIAGNLIRVNGVLRHGIARLNNDIAVPFVRRAIAEGGRITLVASPAACVSTYAVEDQPPTGWPVTDISHDGVFDAATGRVKFGPFYDHEPRTLTYHVLNPVWGVHCALGVFCFSGQASADGVNTPIVGDPCYVLAGYFPADVKPIDRRIGIDEVTAYGAAWRRGSNWECHAHEIPIDYVTRAAALWRAGECYSVEFLITNEPLWWVPCPAEAGVPPRLVRAGLLASGGTAERQVPVAFVPGEPLTVTIMARPAAEAAAYAVEDALPAGWTVAHISHEGELDALHGKVKWGPFLDATPRDLTYCAVPPAASSGAVAFTGAASFDGTSIPVTGARHLCAGSRLRVALDPATSRLVLNLAGPIGSRHLIEASTDLARWLPVSEVTASPDGVAVLLDSSLGEPQQFYRARRIE